MSRGPLNCALMAAEDWVILPGTFHNAVGESGDFIWTDVSGVEHRESFVLELLESSLKGFKRRLLLSMPPFPLLYCRGGLLNAVSSRMTLTCELGSVASHLCPLSSIETAPVRLEFGDSAFTWKTKVARVSNERCRYSCSEGLVLGLCGPEGFANRGQLLPIPWTTIAAD